MKYSRLSCLPSFGHMKLHSGFTPRCTTRAAVESVPQGLLGNLVSGLGLMPHLQGKREEISEHLKCYTHQKLASYSVWLLSDF